MSRPAILSAFLCPGLGHWAAGWPITGALITTMAVVSAGAPFATFIYGIAVRTGCLEGLWPCTKAMLAHAWSLTAPVLLVCAPVFALVYVGALLHAMGLEIPPDRNPRKN